VIVLQCIFQRKRKGETEREEREEMEEREGEERGRE
jgi:hypothetical protein